MKYNQKRNLAALAAASILITGGASVAHADPSDIKDTTQSQTKESAKITHALTDGIFTNGVFTKDGKDVTVSTLKPNGFYEYKLSNGVFDYLGFKGKVLLPNQIQKPKEKKELLTYDLNTKDKITKEDAKAWYNLKLEKDDDNYNGGAQLNKIKDAPNAIQNSPVISQSDKDSYNKKLHSADAILKSISDSYDSNGNVIEQAVSIITSANNGGPLINPIPPTPPAPNKSPEDKEADAKNNESKIDAEQKEKNKLSEAYQWAYDITQTTKALVIKQAADNLLGSKDGEIKKKSEALSSPMGVKYTKDKLLEEFNKKDNVKLETVIVFNKEPAIENNKTKLNSTATIKSISNTQSSDDKNNVNIGISNNSVAWAIQALTEIK